MPAYDFQCRPCGRVFEHRMSMADFSAGQRPACPGCGDPSPERSFHAPITIFSRSGLADSAGGNDSSGMPSSGGCGGGGCGCH